METIMSFIDKWECVIYPAVLVIVGIAAIIVKKTSNTKDDKIVETVEDIAGQVNEGVKKIKESIDKKKEAK